MKNGHWLVTNIEANSRRIKKNDLLIRYLRENPGCLVSWIRDDQHKAHMGIPTTIIVEGLSEISNKAIKKAIEKAKRK